MRRSFALIFLPKIIQNGFKVSFSALTLPWVTTAASLYNVNHKIYFIDILSNGFNVLFAIEIIWARIIVLYVLYKYIMFLITKDVVYS
ncbi:hypothetical protein [Mammaliicoccus fleurettii]|uniref:hypothetical protein n=1 Tax=Mammaliicoccus fleurettii TaxID=150056 RepID=UPI001AAD12DA|nr:hypothetical protein [Mammaliicoccus fleurettii]MBO3061340.1 hypothetical protein [Mammaliicoccus fleurettii]